jgi:benzoyl-CoA reductase/2-hydroxyglutaryl-CoA dehydratase subunit BcrC/BadD/HgdB
MSTTSEPNQTDRIRALNDDLRQNISRGRSHAVMTTGIAALGAEAVARIVKTIEVYDDFCHANDPHQEHDFGSFEADGHTIFFKIDYFDKDLKYHSPDPADPTVTERVITIMLAEEY